MHLNRHLWFECQSLFFAENLFTVDVPKKLPKDSPRTQPSAFLQSAEKVFIIIHYRDLEDMGSTVREVHAMQLAYLMRAAKMLGSNTSLVELELTIQPNSYYDDCYCEPVRNLIWPFLLFVHDVRKFTVNLSYTEGSRRDLIQDNLKELLGFKRGTKGLANIQHTAT